MRAYNVYRLAVVVFLHAGAVISEPVGCEVRARLESGWVCGLRRFAENNTVYASFRGVPYAKQPLGELRFKELEPAEPWDSLDASEEGPICPQHDVFYGKMMTSHKMEEACIYANIHVPIEALPESSLRRPLRHLKPPYEAGLSEEDEPKQPGLPILVFVHGGGFSFGSGNSDVYGPEYLVSKGVIVITFNYRLNVFGFLSLNTPSIPGNNAIRDVITLLRWVRTNARSFGGDPEQVTLGGQSAGATIAHLTSFAPDTEGLFNRLILMSGTAMPAFYTLSPVFAQNIASMFLTHLNITSTDPELAHSELIKLPIDKIMNANRMLIDYFGLTTFVPVLEQKIPGVNPVVLEDPITLMNKGVGRNMEMFIGFTTAECESFRPRFEQIDMITRINENPLLVLSPSILFNAPPSDLLNIAKEVEQKYFNGEPTMDNYIHSCSDTFYNYPALKIAQMKQAMGGAPVFLYQFSYEGKANVIKTAFGINYKGVGHVEDMTYVFKVNSIMGKYITFPSGCKDDLMRKRMTTFVSNFVKCGYPNCIGNEVAAWRPVDRYLRYQEIENTYYKSTDPTDAQIEMLEFFNNLYNTTAS
ncbi:PREDICTED: juvenile hormone esterase-like [Papilio xuthus]|uniref:Carboxylic ester hydrolase n=1 Tax=Papilio xuthus TaxID=66420 RepID=A0AAJ6ZEM3_PAPXU|nr:PREDICTED: juvenile hormone esterase-like [Papilio xuthus]